MSLLIPNTNIYNLYYDGIKVKAAYFDDEQVWTEKHRVRWFDNLDNLLKIEWVTDGKSATPPNITKFDSNFYGYVFEGWNADYSNITADIDISALTTIKAAYLFRKGYGVNYDILENGFSAVCTVYDDDSNTSYSSVGTGTVSGDSIACSTSGSTSSANNTFRTSRYRAAYLDVDGLKAEGFTRLSFSGTYSIDAGTVYDNKNIRSVFVALQTLSRISITSAEGVSGDNQIEYYANKRAGAQKTASVSALSGNISGNIELPESGGYYLIIGSASKAYKGKVNLIIKDIWLE
ncbi:MAG: hypothetical protein J6L81_04805 [Clostridia bacterium]|nr:hypothetical protein [Clostridia bacterium]